MLPFCQIYANNSTIGRNETVIAITKKINDLDDRLIAEYVHCQNTFWLSSPIDNYAIAVLNEDITAEDQAKKMQTWLTNRYDE